MEALLEQLEGLKFPDVAALKTQLATGVGQLPATIVYSYVGGMLTGGVKYFVTALLCIFALSILCVIAKGLYNDRQAKKAAGEKKNG